MSTPALARATKALTTLDDAWGLLYPEHAAHAGDIAKRIVSAALHDPDDPDWLKRVVSDAADSFWDVNPLPGDEYGSQTERLYAHVADAVRAAILGEA